MDVIVIGSGITGMATAWQLHEAGHRVRVIERHANVAQGATHGHSGIVLPSALGVWFGPSFMRRERSLPTGMIDKAGLYGTARAFIKRLAKWQKPEAFAAQYSLLHPLLDLAQHELNMLAHHGLSEQIEEPRYGLLHLVRNDAEFALLQPALELLQRLEIPHQVMNADECVALEHAAPTEPPFAGGVWLPESQVMNCPLFVRQLRQTLDATGNVQFVMGRAVSALRLDAQRASVELAPDPMTALASHKANTLSADAIVVAAGAGTPALVEKQGITLPFYPVNLFTLSAPLAHEECVPMITLADSLRRITLTRSNQRMRISGGAVIRRAAQIDDPLPAALTEEAMTLLGETARTWAPGAAKIADSLPWEDFKLLSFDGLPAVGRTAHPRLFISAGHGPAGWAQALGSGKLIAELLSGATPSLPEQTVEALRPERFVH